MAAPASPTMTIPAPGDILDLIGMLIDDEPALAPATGWDLLNPPQNVYITFLLGRDQTAEAAVITDLPATLYIGGKLIMLPEATAREQLATGQVSEPVLEAVNEVVNNLRTLINNIDGNPHVAPTATFPYQVPTPDDLVGWIHNPGARLDLAGDTSLGRATLTIIAP